ncbi:phosphotransferase [Psychrobium sp. MM17-31]|uniref:phosphotransferase n=1 Tax=Psychrobium sp. MM17-31 TaxID=2917758 RepID=UPI001EF447B3|nr:phosphotransferase [Psychrobium sp. MM17-31]MCG7531845.1 phosphotransferase [Psychrobium sp. MM17-31]
MPELSIQLLCNSRYFSGFSVISVTPLHGGLSQRLYQVQYRNDDELKSVVVRCIQDAQLAREEYELMQHAMDLAPRLRTIEDVDIDDGAFSIIVMDFIEGDLAKDCELSTLQLTTIATQLTRLHQSLPSCPIKRPSVNKLRLIDDYWQLIEQPSLQDVTRFNSAVALVNSLTFDNDALIHGDLNLSNLIVGSDSIIWLDWEYASVGDAYFDYATLVVEAPNRLEQAIITALQKAGNTVIDSKRLTRFKLYYALVSWLWCLGCMQRAKTQTPQLTAAFCKYQQAVDQLTADICASDNSL